MLPFGTGSTSRRLDPATYCENAGGLVVGYLDRFLYFLTRACLTCSTKVSSRGEVLALR